MSTIKLNGEPFTVSGYFLKRGALAPNFTLVNDRMENITLNYFQGKIKCLFTMPSIETPVCEKMAKIFNDLALHYANIEFIFVTKDLPFAQKRFCSYQSLGNLKYLSDIRVRSNFGKDYGILINDGPLEGLFARTVLVLNEKDIVMYSEFVEEVTEIANIEDLKDQLNLIRNT